jgi:hypothetical protein
MDKVNELPTESEIIGPLNYVDVSVPGGVLWPNRKEVSGNESLFNFLKSKNNERFSGIFVENSDGDSDEYVFRGFVRRSGQYNENDVHRYSSIQAEDNLHQNGHEKKIRLEDVDQLITSQNLHKAIGFARPKHSEEVGYLVVYDNKDGLFNSESYLAKINMSDLRMQSNVRDKVRAVIVIKPEIKTAFAKRAVERGIKFFKR